MNLKILGAVAALAVALPMATSTASYAAGRGFHGGGFHGGGFRGGGFHGGGWHGGGMRFGGGGWHRGGGFGPGLAAGAVIGGALAAGAYNNSYGYYGGGPYYGNSYAYDATPYDDGADVIEVAPTSGGDVNYCIQTYKSYNVRTGTYLGYDGQRHACP